MRRSFSAKISPISLGSLTKNPEDKSINKDAIRILIADDHGILREALRSYFQQRSEFEVIAEAKNGSEVLEKCRETNPDIVIMDIAMPEMNGIECSIALKAEYPQIGILALTTYEDEEHLRDCLLAGVNGYILKRSFSEDLKIAIQAVHRGGVYIDSAVADKLRAVISNSGTKESPLTERELQVISMIARGLSLKDISAELKISVKTVETYKARSLEKLNLKSRADLVKYAIDNGLLSTG